MRDLYWQNSLFTCKGDTLTLQGLWGNSFINIYENNNKINTGPHPKHYVDQNLVFLSQTLKYLHPASYKLLKYGGERGNRDNDVISMDHSLQ